MLRNFVKYLKMALRRVLLVSPSLANNFENLHVVDSDDIDIWMSRMSDLTKSIKSPLR